MKKTKFIIFSFLFFIAIHHSIFITHCSSQWLLQPLPVSGDVYDIKFFDSNTGLISVPGLIVLRTTNGGLNWNIINLGNIFGMQKIDSTTMYGYGRNSNVDEVIYRTYNKGLTWDSVSIFAEYAYKEISFINKDTGWISGFDGGNNRIWKTTNGGVTLQPLPMNIGWGKIFFLKYKINGEYYGWCSNDIDMFRTTNSGVNWIQITSTGHLLEQLEFLDENTGYTTFGGNAMLKTTNGGQNWITQILPDGNGIIDNFINKFKIIGRDTIYGDYGIRLFGNKPRGIIWVTTNGGLLWGFQQPDTSYHIARFNGIEFVDAVHGWSSNISTVNGGGTILIIANNEQITDSYKLYQNYPNPFNASTTITFILKKYCNVNLKIYDILGREIITLLNETKKAGKYEVNWSANNYSSGIYYYSIFVDGYNTETKKMILTK